MRRVLPVLLLLSVVPGQPAHPAAERKTPNVTVEKRLPYSGGTELAFDGRYVYAGQFNGRFDRFERPGQGGVRIFDSRATPPRLVGTIRCAGTDMDVAVVRPGVLAVAHHASACGVRGDGVTTFDVRDPARPRKLSSVAVAKAHTLTAVPGTSLVYVSPGGTGGGGGYTTVLDLADARRPKVLGVLRVDYFGCHDVTFSTTPTGRKLGVCTGFDGVKVWDMADPVRPNPLSAIPRFDRVTRDEIQFAHGAAISPDGTLLVVNDEAFYGHQCSGPGNDDEYGSLHLYDIADPARPVFLGRIKPPRGAVRYSGRWVDTWCTSHQLNFAPGSRRLVNAWFTGGVSVWDLTVPSAPREEAYYVGSGAVTWTAHWFGDRVWVNDMARGLEVLKVSLLPTGGPLVSPAWTPAAAVARRTDGPTAFPLPSAALICPV